jgi:hypothetical protein
MGFYNTFTEDDIYCLYKGEEFITTGNVDEIAEHVDKKPSTIKYYARESYKRRRTSAMSDSLILIKLD